MKFSIIKYIAAAALIAFVTGSVAPEIATHTATAAVRKEKRRVTVIKKIRVRPAASAGNAVNKKNTAGDPDFGDVACYGTLISTNAIVRPRSSGREDMPEFHGSLVRGPVQPKRAFNTDYEETPWVALDLRSPRQITALRIKNANFKGKFPPDTKPLIVEVSDDGVAWRTVYEDNESRLEWKIDFTKATGKAAGKAAAGSSEIIARHVRIGLKHGVPRTLQLSRVSIFGKTPWQSLFNGRDLSGWQKLPTHALPAHAAGSPAKTTGKPGWSVRDGVLTLAAKSGAGDLVSIRTFANFEFQTEFRLTPRANSGIKYFVQTDADKNPGIGPEFQLYDDTRPNAKNDGTNYYEIGSLYNIYPSSKERIVRSPGVWRTARIVATGDTVEHWLDGVRVLTYNRHSADFRARVAKTKFKTVPNYGEHPAGHLLLQDHGCEVSFRNLKIREL